MLGCEKDVTIFTDPRNLIFTFHSIDMEPALGLHKVFKVIHMALYLYEIYYRIENVPGEIHTMTFIMSLWMRDYRRKMIKTSRVVRLRSTGGVDRLPTA